MSPADARTLTRKTERRRGGLLPHGGGTAAGRRRERRPSPPRPPVAEIQFAPHPARRAAAASADYSPHLRQHRKVVAPPSTPHEQADHRLRGDRRRRGGHRGRHRRWLARAGDEAEEDDGVAAANRDMSELLLPSAQARAHSIEPRRRAALCAAKPLTAARAAPHPRGRLQMPPLALARRPPIWRLASHVRCLGSPGDRHERDGRDGGGAARRAVNCELQQLDGRARRLSKFSISIERPGRRERATSTGSTTAARRPLRTATRRAPRAAAVPSRGRTSPARDHPARQATAGATTTHSGDARLAGVQRLPLRLEVVVHLTRDNFGW